ncbi:hypothetical protein [Helicobacter sp. 23-1045]
MCDESARKLLDSANRTKIAESTTNPSLRGTKCRSNPHISSLRDSANLAH